MTKAAPMHINALEIEEKISNKHCDARLIARKTARLGNMVCRLNLDR